MRILVAPDSFKDALSAAEAAKAIARGLRRKASRHSIVTFPLSDGGEGALAVLSQHLKLAPIEVETVDALFRPIRAAYGVSADGAQAVIELASAAGLQQLRPEERNPLETTTLGVGLMLADAIKRGAREILLAIGGSATNDCGVGIAQALGWRFLDEAGASVRPVGADLVRVARIEAPADPNPPCVLRVARDVQIPLLGATGAAHVFARQKGADEAAIAVLEAGAANLCEAVHRDIDLGRPETFPGAGAAGGAGFGAMVFAGAHLFDGAEAIMETTGFQAECDRADLIVTGEGRLDAQTGYGKVIAAIGLRAQWNGRATPVVALCGRVEATRAELDALHLREAVEISDRTRPLAEQLARTAANLERAAFALPL